MRARPAEIGPSRRVRAGILAAVALAACGDSPARVAGTAPSCGIAPTPGIAPARVPETSRYDSLFEAAAAEFRVPPTVLRAIGYVETRWQMVEGHEEFADVPAAYGLMALRGARLRDGARLAGLTDASVRTDARANVRAAAALLRADADVLGVTDAEDVEAWWPVVARFSGIALPAGRDGYVREVEAVRDGRRSAPATAMRSVAPCGSPAPVPPAPTLPAAPSTDQSGAVWRGSPNFNVRMVGDGGVVHVVIIHSCEGSYTGCWSWLADPVSQVSAHYVVREDGAEITQLVRESARAWHIGATYDAALNANHEPKLQGIQGNHFTIGIEHAGFASQTTWPVEQIDASARLVCALAKRWQVPRDRMHLVSHGQLQPYNRTDPGQHWPWADYLARIDRYCTA